MSRITIDTETCIGCGACAAVCPELFELKEGKAHVKNAEPDSLGCAKEALEACPVKAITVTE